MPDTADTGSSGEISPAAQAAINRAIAAFDAASEQPPPNNPHPIIKAFFETNPKATALIVRFDGSGDNGNTDPAVAACNVQKDISDYKELEDITLTPDVFQAADDIAMAALDRQGHDWVNNDGGYGYVAILRHGRVYLSTNVGFTSSENHKARYNLSTLCTPTTTQ